MDVHEPRPGEVLIKVAHAGVNFKDVMSRRGDPGYAPTWPHVPGMEVEGRILALGPNVTDLKVGQPIVALTNDGGLASLARANALLTVPRPDSLDPTIAVAIPAAVTTAVLLLDRAGLSIGDAIFMHSAASTVAAAVAQIARHRGARTIVGSVGDLTRAAAARARGYDEVLVRGADFSAAGEFDVILDPHGTRYIDDDLTMAAAGGRILLFGNASGEVLGSLPPASALFPRSLSIGGFSLKGLSAADPARVRRALQTAMRLVDDGVVRFQVEVLEGLHQAPVAHDALAAGVGRGKYVVRL